MLRVLKNKILRHPGNLLYMITVIAMVLYTVQNNLKFENFNFLKNFFSTQLNKTGLVNMSLPKVAENYVKPTKNSIKPVKLYEKHRVEPNVKYKMGHVNVHLWNKMCTGTIDSLRQFPLFPAWPSVRGQPEMPNELVSIMATSWSAQRIMGLLYPPHSGDYRFKISSTTTSEFWLSTSQDPNNAVLLARINDNFVNGISFKTGLLILISKPVHLDHGKVYYFEMIHAMNDVMHDQVQVRWMLPGAKDFTAIPKTSLSTVITSDTSLDMQTRKVVLRSPSLALQENTPRKPEPHTWVDTNFLKPFEAYPLYTRENLHTLKFANSAKIMESFKDCEYAPSYLEKPDYNRLIGRLSEVFPYDDTGRKFWNGRSWALYRQGNKIIEETVVINIVKIFMALLKAVFPGEYLLANVVNVERKVDVKRGNRFFLELVLLEVKTRELQRLSEYVYHFKNSSYLCKPEGLKWSPTVKINAIITAKNQGPWVVHYIKSMAKVLHATRDRNVHFIIVDFGNNGVNIGEELRRNRVGSYTLIKKTGRKFHKTLAIHEATQTIQDGNSIVFLTDLHLDVPNNIFESVRKHAIQGKMAYTPLVFRLAHCGRPDSEQTTASGFWEIDGYGVFGTYMSDWKYFGGVDVTKFKYKWGGEDTEMAQRVYSKGIEIERLRLPHFYHFHHDKSGMWERA